MIITVAPRVILASTSSSQTVIENNTISLNCQIASDPKPIFTWYKNGNEISRSTYMSISSHSSRIMLHNVSTADAGNYTCFSRNMVGNTTTNPMSIKVYSKSANTSILFLYWFIPWNWFTFSLMIYPNNWYFYSSSNCYSIYIATTWLR